VSERTRRAADAAGRVSRVAALLVAIVLLGWLAGWHGPRVAGVGIALLGLGWLLHDDAPPADTGATTTDGGAP
jgi:hypothetical protein